jgi:hypothetical protein
MGIATYMLRLAARNTPSGSPRFLALPVFTLPFNRAKSCLLRRRPPSFDDEARAVRAIASVSRSVAHSLRHEREGYRANAEPQSKLFYSTNRGSDPRVEFCATPAEILAYAASVFRQMGSLLNLMHAPQLS